MRRESVRAVVLAVAFGVCFAGAAQAQSRPAAPPENLRGAPDKAGWHVDERTGCWIWLSDSGPNLSVHWSGSCGSNGPAVGRGTLEFRVDGKFTDRYEGELRDGKKHGRGVQTDVHGNRFEGEFRNGTPHGHGINVFYSGSRFEGEYRDGERNGRGIWMGPSGIRYEGEYRDDRQHGRGIGIDEHGNRYEGEWRKGSKHGRGVLQYKNGARYEGEFQEDLRHGRGVLAWPNGNRYDGEWRGGLPDGLGEYTYQGQKYTGAWARGCLRVGDGWAAIGRDWKTCP